MIIFEQTLRDLLIRTNLVADRVFLMKAPQVPADKAVYPYIVFFKVGPLNTIQHTTHRGPLDQNEADYQVSVFDKSQSRAIAIADSIRMYFHTMHGDYENVHIGHSFYMTQTWSWESDTLLFQVIQEYRIMYNYLAAGSPPVSPSATQPARRTHEHHNDASATRNAGRNPHAPKHPGIPDRYAAE